MKLYIFLKSLNTYKITLNILSLIYDIQLIRRGHNFNFEFQYAHADADSRGKDTSPANHVLKNKRRFLISTLQHDF